MNFNCCIESPRLSQPMQKVKLKELISMKRNVAQNKCFSQL